MFSVAIGNGGWVRWETGVPSMVGLIRFEELEGRLEPVELHMPMVPSQRDCARLPVTDLEAWANSDGAEYIRARINVPGPLLTVAASHYATTFGSAGNSNWVSDMMHSQLPGSGVPTVSTAKRRPMSQISTNDISAKLDVPEDRPYGLEFFEDVAALYSELAYRTRKPVAQIADENGVPLSTAQRWIRRCRELELLPPAHHGKRG